MAGGVWGLFGCGDTDSSTFVNTNPTDTLAPTGERLYVADTATNTVFRFDTLDFTVSGTAVSASAQFTNFNKVARVNTDFLGDLLVADSGLNTVSKFATAELDTGTISAATLLFQLTGINGTSQTSQDVAFDSTDNIFFVATGTNIQVYSATGQLINQFNDEFVTNPVALAVDDQTNVNGHTSTLFVVGQNAAGGGELSIIDDAANQTSGTATSTFATTTFNNQTMVSPTSVTLDGGDHLWIADPGANRVFRLDGASNALAGSAIGGSIQVANVSSVAVDTSNVTGVGTGIPVLITGTSTSPSIQIFVDSLETSGNTILDTTDVAVSPTAVLNLTGVTGIQNMADDSTH